MRHTRKQVIDRTRREFARLDRVVSRLRPADWKRSVPRPLAHILYWKEHTRRVIRGVRRLPDMRGLDIEGINRLVYERWRRRRPSELVAWHRRVHADVLETLAKTPSEFFGRRERSREWPLDFDGHSAAHRVRDIEAALGRLARRPAHVSKRRRTRRETTNQR
jgi:hypothetical protein